MVAYEGVGGAVYIGVHVAPCVAGIFGIEKQDFRSPQLAFTGYYT